MDGRIMKLEDQVMGGTIINDYPHIPTQNVIFLLQEFFQGCSQAGTFSSPCKETK